jgi:microcystin-dependent protein
MASTYTTNLRLTKQGDGENPNSWGQILNDGVISLVDDAVAGYTAVSVGSAASVNLTADSGVGDQSRSAFLEITGSIGTAATSIFVLIPNNSKSYVVHNSVSYNDSSNALMVRVAGNTGVTINQGQSKYIFTDGATVRGITQESFGSITTGNLNVDGNIATNGTVSVSGAATFNSTVTVSGAATFKSTFAFEGSGSFGSSVTVVGAGTFKNNVSVSGNIDAAGNVSIGGSQTFTGAGTFASTVTVSGNATFSSNVTVKGNLFVSSKVCASAFHGDGSNLTGIVAMPTGSIIPFGGLSAPSGFLLCYGQQISRTTYATLFGVINTTYGTGDGSSTFNLPDLRGRVVAGQDDMGGSSANRLTNQTGGVNGDTLGGSGGAETHTLTEAQLASHSHAAAMQQNFDDGSGITRTALGTTADDRSGVYRTSTSEGGGANNLLIANTGSGAAHNNVQPTFILNYIIKT